MQEKGKLTIIKKRKYTMIQKNEMDKKVNQREIEIMEKKQTIMSK